jgi:heme o synthase
MNNDPVNQPFLTRLKRKAAAIFELGKPQITIPVSLSTLTGYILLQGSFTSGWLQSVAGVFLMSFASSAINHFQDADIDKLMERTRKRPIPSGRITPFQSLIVALITGLSGFIILINISINSLPASLSLITLICYNLIYTPLKRVTAFAVIPGAMVGALPPMIGWAAAGGDILHPHILFVGFFFFVGQIPHFWLILLKYDKDYAAAGIPTLLQLFSHPQIQRLTLVWVAVTAMAALLLVIAGVLITNIAAVLVLLFTLFTVGSFRSWLKAEIPQNPHRAFMRLNLFYLAIMLVIIADALMR